MAFHFELKNTNSLHMKFFIYLIFFFLTFNLFSQPPGAKVELRNGVKCYIHKIQPGNTLYGLHRLYNVSIEEIKSLNPGITENFKEGQEVLIPVTNVKVSEVQKPISRTDKTSQIFHKVQTKETLYGISKKYNVSIESIKALNPVLNQGLKPGQELKINIVKHDDNYQPSTSSYAQSTKKEEDINQNQVKVLSNTTDSVQFKPDSIVKHKVLPDETLFTISKRYMIPTKELYNYNDFKASGISPGDIINVPVKNENGKKVGVRKIVSNSQQNNDLVYKLEKKELYKIAILLPFYLDEIKNDTLKNKEFISTVSNLSTDFYMGLTIAIDSLKELGLTAEVRVFDTQNDSLHLASLLSSSDFKNLDLIIGPLLGSSIDQVANWSKVNHVKMICPVATNTNVLKQNVFVDIAIASDFTLMEELASYLVGNTTINDKIILIKPKNNKDILLYERFRESYLLASKNNKSKLIETNLKDYKVFIQKDVKTHLILPTTDEMSSLKFMSELMSISNNSSDNILVYGTKEWLNFENMNGAYRNKFNFHFAAPNNFNYENNDLLKVAKNYRKLYDTDFTKMSALGFDVTLAFLSKYLLGISDIHHGVMGDYNLLQKGEGNGFENNAVWIMKQENFELIKVFSNE